jgi:NAD-dependent deacetylase
MSAGEHRTIERVAGWLAEARRGVAFTGAGISTESGIPDFRSPGGVWSRNRPVYFDEYLASGEARLEYWRQKCEAHAAFASARPNDGHEVLARWESAGRLRGVVTQNIDGLHQLAGSRRVLELHGTAREIACLECAARWPADELVARFLASQVVPVCASCGGIVKHATISFGQMLPGEVLNEAVEWSRQADFYVAIGSSLVVTPAAELPRLAVLAGARLVIINRDPTPHDGLAAAILRAPIGSALRQLEEAARSIGAAPG